MTINEQHEAVQTNVISLAEAERIQRGDSEFVGAIGIDTEIRAAAAAVVYAYSEAIKWPDKSEFLSKYIQKLSDLISVRNSQGGLTGYEINELRELTFKQRQAHADGDFAQSDLLRSELMEYGAWPPERGYWSMLESPEHCAERYRKRKLNNGNY